MNAQADALAPIWDNPEDLIWDEQSDGRNVGSAG
jgi:hypothetical protein